MSTETNAADDAGSHAQVDVASDDAVRRWAAALGVTDEALMRAVQVVGHRVDRIKEYLGEGGNAGEQIDG